MSYVLTKDNKRFISHMLAVDRFKNQSEIVREALRRMEREETSYLNPPPLTEAETKRIFGRDEVQDNSERQVVRKAADSLRRTIKRKKLKLQDM